MSRKVFIAVPCHDGALRVGTVMSLFDTMNSGIHNGLSFDFRCWVGDSLLPHARNILIGQFLASDCTDMIFIDSDISWAPGTVARIMSHPVDFVAGTYRFKSATENYPVRWLREENDVNEHGLFDVAGVPTGFFRMTRAGLERVVAKCEHLKYRSHNCPEYQLWCLFNLRLGDDRFWGEDYVFCDLIRELGETIWLDPDLSLTHSGTFDYAGHFGGFIQEAMRDKSSDDEKRDYDARVHQFIKAMSTPEMDRLFRQAAGEAPGQCPGQAA